MLLQLRLPEWCGSCSRCCRLPCCMLQQHLRGGTAACSIPAARRCYRRYRWLCECHAVPEKRGDCHVRQPVGEEVGADLQGWVGATG